MFRCCRFFTLVDVFRGVPERRRLLTDIVLSIVKTSVGESIGFFCKCSIRSITILINTSYSSGTIEQKSSIHNLLLFIAVPVAVAVPVPATEATVIVGRSVPPAEMRVSELKAALAARGVDTSGMVEKYALVSALEECET
jgi:hypothetical protein